MVELHGYCDERTMRERREVWRTVECGNQHGVVLVCEGPYDGSGEGSAVARWGDYVRDCSSRLAWLISVWRWQAGFLALIVVYETILWLALRLRWSLLQGVDVLSLSGTAWGWRLLPGVAPAQRTRMVLLGTCQDVLQMAKSLQNQREKKN